MRLFPDVLDYSPYFIAISYGLTAFGKPNHIPSAE